jgi:hypothetical protein
MIYPLESYFACREVCWEVKQEVKKKKEEEEH